VCINDIPIDFSFVGRNQKGKDCRKEEEIEDILCIDP
jgi:hypothetical protein